MITTEEILKNEVRALSWKQPYGALMLHGKWETRTWATNYRGLVLICASATSYNQAQVFNISGTGKIHDDIETIFHRDDRYKITGQAFAIGRLTDCKKMSEINSTTLREVIESKTFTKFNSDSYVHIYRDVREIVTIPWKGQQGWKRLTDTEKLLIKPFYR